MTTQYRVLTRDSVRFGRPWIGNINVQPTENEVEKVAYCCTLLACFSQLNPQCPHDGVNNLWIVKPGSKSRGMEITVCNTVEEVTEICFNSQGYPDMRNFIVQKYIGESVESFMPIISSAFIYGVMGLCLSKSVYRNFHGLLRLRQYTASAPFISTIFWCEGSSTSKLRWISVVCQLEIVVLCK